MPRGCNESLYGSAYSLLQRDRFRLKMEIAVGYGIWTRNGFPACPKAWPGCYYRWQSPFNLSIERYEPTHKPSGFSQGRLCLHFMRCGGDARAACDGSKADPAGGRRKPQN